MAQQLFPSHILTVGPSAEKAVEVEFWLDYTCPFSAKFYLEFVNETLPFLKNAALEGCFKIIFRHQIQPWHPQSTYMHEADKVSQGKAFLPYSTLLFQRQTEFFDRATYEKSRSQIYKELAQLAQQIGVDPQAVEQLLVYSPTATAEQLNVGNAMANDLKYFIKLGRMKHIHGSPTVLVNGIENPTVSSSWKAAEWQPFFKSLL
ncbi:hypothetical protein HDU91_006770 [Kappamyces sp. JEL0680]|nr:hypothetical protein HDU91_006770 [Kappamyces sp. JEL0680]